MGVRPAVSIGATHHEFLKVGGCQQTRRTTCDGWQPYKCFSMSEAPMTVTEALMTVTEVPVKMLRTV